MSIFFRINNNKLFSAGEVNRLGFKKSDGLFIPDEYLNRQEFTIMRTCHGIGDWILLSAMPRLLKEKYPKCKVYLPSKKLLENIFGNMLRNWGYGTFDAADVVKNIFLNNPHVDKFVDSVDGEIYHDHFKIYDEQNDKIPLLNQMLKFWQFNDDEITDTTPDFYPTEDEITWFKTFNNFNEYGYLLASSSFENGDPVENLFSVINQYRGKIKNWYYYGEVEFNKSLFNSLKLKNVIEIKPLNLTIRQQQLLKVKANVNFGNETGMSLWTSKYSKSYVLGHTKYTAIHGKEFEGKTRKNPFSSGNFIKGVIYL